MKKDMYRVFLVVFVLFGWNLSGLLAFSPVVSNEAFTALYRAEMEKLRSFECAFTQTKSIAILSEEVVSKGRLSFQRPDLISMVYTEPVSYRVVIAGKNMMIDASGKKQRLELKENTLTGDMQAMIAAGMGGDLDYLTRRYEVQVFENEQQYKILISNRAGAPNAAISGMEILLSRKDFSVDRLIVRESAGDFTQYDFLNKKLNVDLSESLFHML